MVARSALAFLLCLAIGCGGSESGALVELADGVAELGERGKLDDFLVIEAPDSDRFVEFRIAESGALQAEFPIRTVTVPGARRNLDFRAVESPPEIKGREVVHLDQEEIAHLLDVIQLNGLEPKTVDLVALDGEKKPVSWVHILFVELDRQQPERIAEFAFDVFLEVYGLDVVEGFVISKRIKE